LVIGFFPDGTFVPAVSGSLVKAVPANSPAERRDSGQTNSPLSVRLNVFLCFDASRAARANNFAKFFMLIPPLIYNTFEKDTTALKPEEEAPPLRALKGVPTHYFHGTSFFSEP